MLDRTDKALISEEDVRNVPIGSTLRISERALVTPLAADLARDRQIRFERVGGRSPDPKIAIGSDHGGFEMKEALKAFLEHRGVAYVDVGTHSTEAVDYPDFAEAVARAVSLRKCDLGIMRRFYIETNIYLREIISLTKTIDWKPFAMSAGIRGANKHNP